MPNFEIMNAVRDYQRNKALEDAQKRILNPPAPTGEQLSGRGSFNSDQVYAQARLAADNLAAWARSAPTAPPSALIGAARAGITPQSDMGRWLIASAVPALADTSQGTDYTKSLYFMNDPQWLDTIKQWGVEKSTQFLTAQNSYGHQGLGLGDIGVLDPNVAAQTGYVRPDLGTSPDLGGSAAHGIQLQAQDVQRQGVADIGDALDKAKTATREAGVVANTGAQAVSMGIRQQTAGLFKSVSNVAHGESPTAGKTASGIPLDPQAYQTPTIHIPNVADIPGLDSIPGIRDAKILQGVNVGGSKINFGDVSQLTDPGQLELVQQLRGQSVGSGILPGGPAAEQASLAQRAAATVNGHALTPGRALAAYVTPPDSQAFNIASGLVDLQVAIHGDPMNVLVTQLSEAKGASKVFAATPEESVQAATRSILDQGADNLAAVRTWTGAPGDLAEAVAAKVKADPGSIAQLAEAGIDPKVVMRDIGSPYIGAFKGLRKYVSQPNALTWINSDTADTVVNKVAQAGFSDLRRMLGTDVPVEDIAQLGRMRDPAEIRSKLGTMLGTSVRDTPHAGFDWSFDNHPRWAQFMPTGSVSHLDVQVAVEQSERMLSSLKVPPAKWDDILTKVAEAGGQRGAFFKAMDGIASAGAQVLKEDYGLSDARARGLTKFFQGSGGYDSRYWIDEVGNVPYVSGLTVGGEAIPMSGPTLGAELTDHMPTLNGREIRRAASKMGKIFELQDSEHIAGRALTKGATAIDYAAAGYTQAFKIGALARLALPLRITAEAQTRMAAGGLDSTFTHPLDFISWAIGHKGETDLTGVPFLDLLDDQASTFARATGRNGWVNEQSVFDPAAQMAKHWVPVPQAHPDFVPAWADRLSLMHMDQVSRQVARAMTDPENYSSPDGGELRGLDAVKEWFSAGGGTARRDDLVASGLPKMTDLGNRVNADAYIERVVVPQIQQMTANDPGLLDAVAKGTVFGEEGIGRDFISELKQLKGQGIAPGMVMGREPTGKAKLRLFSNMVDRWFSAIVDRPYNELAKSPAYRQFYWQEGARLMPHMTIEAQDALIATAAQNEIKLARASTTGALSVEDAAKLANIRALGDAQGMLHYVSERNNLADTLRYVAPFGDAWRNVIRQWTHVAAENPQIARRVQQGVQEMRNSGFFYQKQNPDGTKTESFTIVPGAGVRALTGVDFKMTAPVKGLNLASEGLPGIGPAVQLPASLLIPRDSPIGDAVRNEIMPYGPPDLTGGIVESLMPGWADRLRTGGWFGPVGKTPDQKVTFDDLAKQVFSYKASTGHYDLSDPNVLAKVTSDSRDAAKRLYLLRGVAQFAAPAAPNYIPRVLADDKTKKIADGGYIETWRLGDDYRTMIEANKGDSYAATLQFINKYGPNYIFATEGLNRRTVYGVPTTADGLAFKWKHPDVVRNYPDTYGFFAPQGGASDYAAYLDAIHSGQIEPLSVETWAKLANARLGNAVYSNLRSRLDPSPGVEQRNWLAAQKEKIEAQFPGFNDDSIKNAHLKLDQSVTQLQRAVKDPALSDMPLAHAATVYMELRSRALTEARTRTGRTTTTLAGNDMADLRQWLYQNGTQIATKIPEFSTMWDYLFQDEVAPPTDAALAAAG